MDRIPTEPFDTFAERFTREARAGVHDLVYLSQVFYDSGFVVPDLDQIVSSVPENRTIHRHRRLPRLHGPTHEFGRHPGPGLLPRRRLQIRHVRRGRLLSPLSAGLWAPPARYRLVRRIRPARIWVSARRSPMAPTARDSPEPPSTRPGSIECGRCSAGSNRRCDAVPESTSMSSRFRTDSSRAASALGDLLVGEEAQRGNFLTFRSDHAGDIYQAASPAWRDHRFPRRPASHRVRRLSGRGRRRPAVGCAGEPLDRPRCRPTPPWPSGSKSSATPIRAIGGKCLPKTSR